MYFKLLIASAFVALCQSALIPYQGAHIAPHGGYGVPIYEPGYGAHEVDYHAYPKYKFGYGVSDPHTGDHKSQEEVRDGDVVKGHYTVAEPDGTLRVVHYTADDHNGFNAVVEKHGQSVHPAPVPIAPVVLKKVVPVVKNVIYDEPYGHAYGGYGHGVDYGQGHHGYGYY